MNDADAKLLEQAQLFFSGPNDMRRDYTVVEKTNSVQIIDGTGAFRFDAVVYFALRF